MMTTPTTSGTTSAADQVAKLQCALQLGEIGYWELEPTSRKLTTSALCRQAFGLPATIEPSFEQWLAGLHADDRKLVRSTIDDALEQQGGYTIECRSIWPDGSVHWLHLRGRTVPSSDGTAGCLVGTSMDVTSVDVTAVDVKGQKTGTTKRENRDAPSSSLRLMAQQSPDFIMVAGLDERLVFLNDTHLTFVELNWQDARDTLLADQFIKEERGDVRGLIIPAVLSKGTWEGELHLHQVVSGKALPIMFKAFRIDDPKTGTATHIAAIARDLRQKKLDEETKNRLIDELNHRVRNTLAIVSSIARQTHRYSDTLDGFAEAFEGRIQALAAMHTLLADRQWRAPTLRTLLQKQLAPHLPHGDAVSLSGPPVALTPKPTLALSLVFHELATNAEKHGALAHRSGHLDVAWTLIEERGANEQEEGRRLQVRWIERGGTQPETPSHTGFGSMLIKANIEHEFRGTIERDFRPEGMSCTLTIPLSADQIILKG